MSDNMSNIIRTGQVSSVDPENNTVRVAFDDMSAPSGKKFVTAPMQMLQKNTVGARNLSLPEVGEHVLCTFLPNGNQEGFVMGSFYTGSNMPDTDGLGVYRTEYADGTIIEYNLGSSTATVSGANARVIVKAKSAEVMVTETVDIKAQGAISLHSDTSITMTAPEINLN